MLLNHSTLKHNNVNVYSVKTDAFVIDADKIELVKSLLNFNNNTGSLSKDDKAKICLGSWRISKTEDIAFPKVKFNNKNEY